MRLLKAHTKKEPVQITYKFVYCKITHNKKNKIYAKR